MTSALGTGTHDNSKDSAHSVHGPGCAIWASQPPSLGLCWERKSCLDRYSVNETGLPVLLHSSRGRSLPMPLMPHPALPATQRGRDWTGGVGGAARPLPCRLFSHPTTRDEVWAPFPLLPQERILPGTPNLSHQDGAFLPSTPVKTQLMTSF